MSWLGRLLTKKTLEKELDHELQFHLEQHIRDLTAAGHSPAEARRRAALELGGLEQVKEDTRDARGTRWVEDWWQDTRFAIRTLRRSPGFTAAAVITLALGIGANTAVFSLVHALLLRPLPLARAVELNVLQRVGIDEDNFRFSHPLFGRLQAALGDSSRLAAMSRSTRMYASTGDQPEPVTAQLVSGGWFPLVGVGAAAGRLFGPNDDRTVGGHPVAVLSHGYWTRRFGRSAAAVGSTIRINNQPLTVIGVAEASFFGLTVGEAMDVWIPTTMQHEVRYHSNASTKKNTDESSPWIPQDGIEWLTLVTRVPADSVAGALARLDQRFRADLAEALGQSDSATRRYRMRERLGFVSAARGLSPLRREFSRPLVALMVSVGLVLLIACANLAGLLLARSAARSHEVAVRVSLGAKAGRLIRQVLTESLTLSLLGGALSLLVARWGGQALLHAASNSPSGIPLEIAFDGRLLAFALGVSIVTGLLFGLAPALRVARGDLYQTFKTGGRVIGVRDPHRASLGRALVVSQIALSLILVTGAGLFIRTLRNLLAVDPGFERDQVVAVRVDPRAGGYPADQLPALYERLTAAVGSVPGVRSASMSLHTFATGSARTSGFQVPGQTHGPEWDSSSQEDLVTPGFLGTVGIGIVRGRDLSVADGAKSPKVAVVSEAMAKHFFGDTDPLGRRFGYDDENPEIEVVGVARDARVNYVKDLPPRMVYRPIAQAPDEYLTGIEARVAGPAERVLPGIRQAIVSVDKSLPVREITTLGDFVRRGLKTERFVSELVGLFGALALLLAAVGLYGVMAYSVARRTNEIGVRLALGAAPREVRWLVLRDTLRLVVLGLAVGSVLLIPSLGLVRSLVYGFSPRDPATLLIAGGILLAAGLLAGTVPAWRAARVDPATALRAE